MPLLKKRGSKKVNLKIDCQLLSIQSTNPDHLAKDVKVEFVRGPQKQMSAAYKFGEGDSDPEVATFSEKMIERVSGFTQSKKGEWQAKILEFKVYQEDEEKKKPKQLASIKFDMSVSIGNHKADPIELKIGKDFLLKFTLVILPACPKLHALLFEMQQQAETIAELQTENGDIRKSNSFLTTQDSLDRGTIERGDDEEEFTNEEQESMQNQINKLTDMLTTKVHELDAKDQGGSQDSNMANELEKYKLENAQLQNQVNYLYNSLVQMSKTVDELNKAPVQAQAEIKNPDDAYKQLQKELEEAKKEPIAMQKEINLLYGAYLSSQAEIKKAKKEPVAMQKEINMLYNVMMKLSSELETAKQEPVKMQNEVNMLYNAYMSSQVQVQTGKNEIDKMQKQINQLYGVVLNSQAQVEKAKLEPIKMQKEVNMLYNAYMTSQAQVEAGKKEQTKMQQEINMLYNAYMASNAQFETGKNEPIKMQKQINQLYGVVLNSQAQVEKAKEEPIKMQKEVNMLYNAYMSSQAQVEAGKKEPIAMQKEINLLYNSFMESNVELGTGKQEPVKNKQANQEHTQMQDEINYLINKMIPSIQNLYEYKSKAMEFKMVEDDLYITELETRNTALEARITVQRKKLKASLNTGSLNPPSKEQLDEMTLQVKSEANKEIKYQMQMAMMHAAGAKKKALAMKKSTLKL